MKRLFLMFLLTAGLCEAWPGRTLQDLDFVGNLIQPSAAGGPSFYPTTGVANVGLFLNYRDNPIGAVGSITNEMPSADVWTNALGLWKEPTNTGEGFYFYNGILTNNTYSNVSAFSIWMVMAMGNNPTNYSQIIGALAAGTTNFQLTNKTGSAAVELGAYYGVASAQATPLAEFTGNSGNATYTAGAVAQTNAWNDFIDAEGVFYWHAVNTGTTFPTPTGNVNEQAIGNNNLAKGSPYLGYLKYLLISTNHQITATEATNLWVWEETNGVTNVSGGLVAWWKIADASNSLTIADSSGNGWTGNCLHSPIYTNGLNGVVFGALSFNGTSTVFAPVTSGFFPSPGLGCTISAWVKFTVAGDASSFICGYANVSNWIAGELGGTEAAGQGWQLLEDGDSNIRGEVNSTTGAETEGNTMGANDGNWHHMVFASDGTNVLSWFDDTRNYIGTLNGTQVGGVQSGTGWLTGETNVQWSGPSGVTNLVPCTMTDVRIYNRLLNDAEVDILYRAPTVDAIIGAYTY